MTNHSGRETKVKLNKIYQGDALTVLRTFPDEAAHCVVTSPPYWGLRDYGVDNQLGLEPTPDEYVARLVDVFREVRRVLHKDGTVWLNLGDSYTSTTKGCGGPSDKQVSNAGSRYRMSQRLIPDTKPKDLVGIPWRVAFALQADGWWLRSDIIWSKPNPMPESITDRPTKAHEYVFLLTKAGRYFYDADAVREAHGQSGWLKSHKTKTFSGDGNGELIQQHENLRMGEHPHGRNKRSVWTVTTKPYAEAHFATMPPDLVEPCVKAGCPLLGTVLDPFMGSGTVGAVAKSLDRDYVGIELNPEYIKLAEKRIAGTGRQIALGLAANTKKES